MAILISVALLFVGIGVLILIHTCVIGRAFRRGFTNNDSNNIAETSSFGSRSMSRDEIEKLPHFDFRARDKGSSPVDCAVCLDNFKAGDKCRLLPLCNHSFHAQCIDLWLLKTPICPVCRSSAADLLTTKPLIPGEESNSQSIPESRHIQATLNDPELGRTQMTEEITFVAIAVAVPINEDHPAAIPQGQ